jgi:flavin-binding protein dodecin
VVAVCSVHRKVDPAYDCHPVHETVRLSFNHQKESAMSVARVSEIKASSTESFDDAMRQGIARAVKTLRNVKSAWIQNQDVEIDDKGNITEYRVQLKVTFVLDD